MSSVHSFDECPQCHYRQALGSLDLSTGNESLFCPRCGYRLLVRAVRNRQRGQNLKQSYEFKMNKVGQIIRRTYERPGYGVCCLSLPGGVQTQERFTQPGNRKTLSWFRQRLKQLGADPRRSYLTRANGRAVKVLFGKFPT